MHIIRFMLCTVLKVKGKGNTCIRIQFGNQEDGGTLCNRFDTTVTYKQSLQIMNVSLSLSVYIYIYGCGLNPCTPCERQNRWYMGVHPPQHGAIGYDPWPYKYMAINPGANDKSCDGLLQRLIGEALQVSYHRQELSSAVGVPSIGGTPGG